MRPLMGPIFSVNYTIFGAPEHHLSQGSGPLSACGGILPSILDTPTFTDQENINSAFGEEPPKMATFHGDRDSSCNLDDPG